VIANHHALNLMIAWQCCGFSSRYDLSIPRRIGDRVYATDAMRAVEIEATQCAEIMVSRPKGIGGEFPNVAWTFSQYDFCGGWTGITPIARRDDLGFADGTGDDTVDRFEEINYLTVRVNRELIWMFTVIPCCEAKSDRGAVLFRWPGGRAVVLGMKGYDA
jgi:hypothetical protein